MRTNGKEIACELRGHGEYGWLDVRRAARARAAGDTRQTTRDIVQFELLGTRDEVHAQHRAQGGNARRGLRGGTGRRADGRRHRVLTLTRGLVLPAWTAMGETENKPAAAFDPWEQLLWAIESLRLPAGADPRFANPESIGAHLDDFVVEVHTTWKRIQVEAIKNIMGIEARLAYARVQPVRPGVEPWLRYVCRLWRRVMDAVIWGMLGKPHMVRRLCANRPRPTLLESNPQVVSAILDQSNDEPKSIAIWADATTCIDVADIVARRNSPEIEFIELKAGKVNEAIGRLHQTLTKRRKAGDTAGAEKAMDEFFETYGAKGFKQAMRFTKQLMRDFKVMDVVNRELGRDPDVGIDVETVETSFGAEIYDFELTACLRQAEAEGSAFRCIDDCLWIFVSPELRLSRRDAVSEFSRRVFEASPETRTWLVERTGRDVLHPVGTVDQWSFVPSAIPIFLRPLEAEDVLELVFGKLMERVWLFFDWRGFENVVRNAGCELKWVKPRQVDGRYLEPIVGKRTPRVIRKDKPGPELGISPMTRIMAEGIRPSSVAAQYAEVIAHLGAGQTAP
jgi:hypothetical protein